MTCAASVSMEADNHGLTLFLEVFSKLREVSLLPRSTCFKERSVGLVGRPKVLFLISSGYGSTDQRDGPAILFDKQLEIREITSKIPHPG